MYISLYHIFTWVFRLAFPFYSLRRIINSQMWKGVRLLVAPSVVFCDTANRQKESKKHIQVGSHQYVANRLIEDRIGHHQIGKYKFITVMDGHGGPQAAEYLTARLPKIFESHSNAQHAKDALRASFYAADKEWFHLVHPAYMLGFTSPIKVGACALAIAIDESEITVASVGDCKCVVAFADGTTKDLNIERNANRREEQERLRKLHPGEEDVVRCKRFDPVRLIHTACYVKGRLQPTKSFGDFHLKDSTVVMDHERGHAFLDPTTPKSFPYIDVDPDITVTSRTGKEKFMIAATDGLWDEFTSQEAASIVDTALSAGLTPEEAAIELVEAALNVAAKHRGISIAELKKLPQGSSRRSVHDDISVCVILV